MNSVIAVCGTITAFPRESRRNGDTNLAFSIETDLGEDKTLKTSVTITGARARHLRELLHDRIDTQGTLDVPVIVYGTLVRQGVTDGYRITADKVAIDTFAEWEEAND